MKKHLAIFKGDGGELILLGKKSMESRFSKRRDPPFGQIAKGDLVYIKPSGKDPIGQFKVRRVIFYDGLEEKDIKEIQLKYARFIVLDKQYWERKLGSRYGTLIFIAESSRFITAPIKVPKKDLRGWVVLG